MPHQSQPAAALHCIVQRAYNKEIQTSKEVTLGGSAADKVSDGQKNRHDICTVNDDPMSHASCKSSSCELKCHSGTVQSTHDERYGLNMNISSRQGKHTVDRKQHHTGRSSHLLVHPAHAIKNSTLCALLQLNASITAPHITVYLASCLSGRETTINMRIMQT